MKRKKLARARPLIGHQFERLESRYALTVAAAVANDVLDVSGDADGAVTITAIDATTYKVTDNGADVATAQNVTGGIQIGIDSAASANDSVTIDLGGQAVDKLMANLGGGNNSLIVQNGTVRGNLSFTG